MKLFMNKAPARERERERERKREKGRKREREGGREREGEREDIDNYGKNKTVTVFLFQESLLLINFKNSCSVGILSNCMLRFNHIL